MTLINIGAEINYEIKVASHSLYTVFVWYGYKHCSVTAILQDGGTPLHCASYMGHKEVVEVHVLIKHACMVSNWTSIARCYDRCLSRVVCH